MRFNVHAHRVKLEALGAGNFEAVPRTFQERYG